MKINDKRNDGVCHLSAGQVISWRDSFYMVVLTPDVRYVFVDLKDGLTSSESYETIGELFVANGIPTSWLVNAELVVKEGRGDE